MDWTHVAAFAAPYIPTIGAWLRDTLQRRLDAKHPSGDLSIVQKFGAKPTSDLSKVSTTDLCDEIAKRNLSVVAPVGS